MNERRVLPSYEEQERGRAYRVLHDAGFTAWPEHGSAPDWACRLSYFQNCGAAHFERLPWERIWQRAALDPNWPEAFLAVDVLEEERNEGSAFEKGKRIAKWLEKSTTRRRKR